jgi:predicted RNA binding protein YcfA (HicA-like mRNA interferase family)
MGKLPRLNAAEVIDILKRHGFVMVSQRGSHQKWYNPQTGKQVIVPYHKANHSLWVRSKALSKAAVSRKRNFVVNGLE